MHKALIEELIHTTTKGCTCHSCSVIRRAAEALAKEDEFMRERIAELKTEVDKTIDNFGAQS